MSTTITIDGAGRLVLPKKLRDRLSLKAGTRLRAELVGERIELTPEPDNRCGLIKTGGALVITGTTTTDSRSAIKATRDDRESTAVERTRQRSRE